MAGEIENVENAAEGTRNQTLYHAALKLKGIINAGVLDESTVIDDLTAAAQRAGLNYSEIWPTINSGFRAQTDIRTLPEGSPVSSPSGGGGRASEFSWGGGNEDVWGEFPPIDGADWVFGDDTPPIILWGSGNDILWADGEALMIAGSPARRSLGTRASGAKVLDVPVP